AGRQILPPLGCRLPRFRRERVPLRRRSLPSLSSTIAITTDPYRRRPVPSPDYFNSRGGRGSVQGWTPAGAGEVRWVGGDRATSPPLPGEKDIEHSRRHPFTPRRCPCAIA